MKGQLSLELLIILLIFSSLFVVMLSNIDYMKNIGDYSIDFRNAELILDRIYSACERVYISGENSEEILILSSLTEYSLNSSMKHNSYNISISFDSFNGSKTIKLDTKFPCNLNGTLKEGRNVLLINYYGSRLMPSSNFSG